MDSMKAKRMIACFLLFSALFLGACGGEGQDAYDPLTKGETYLDGTYMNEALGVGYKFLPDGTGFQFISLSQFLIRYGVVGDHIVILTIKDGKNDVQATLPFSECDGALWIDGLEFVPVI